MNNEAAIHRIEDRLDMDNDAKLTAEEEMADELNDLGHESDCRILSHDRCTCQKRMTDAEFRADCARDE